MKKDKKLTKKARKPAPNEFPYFLLHRRTENEIDFAPVAKLYTPLGDAIWLLTEIDPKDADKAFGLHDSGKGDAELCYVSLTELELRFAQLSVRRDKDFQTDELLSGYARKAGVVGER